MFPFIHPWRPTRCWQCVRACACVCVLRVNECALLELAHKLAGMDGAVHRRLID